MLIVFDLDDTLYDCSGQVKYESRWQDARRITAFPGAVDFLSSHPSKKILLSRETDTGLQNVKIDSLGIRDYFVEIYLCQRGEEKKTVLEKIQREYSSEDIWVVGDRIDSEIQFGNELGLKTVRLSCGKYKDMMPQHKLQEAHHTITEFLQLYKVLPK